MLNHDLVQTVEYWEEGYNEEMVLGTINAIRSPLVATLDPGADTYALGETLAYDLKIQNWTKRDQEAYVVVEAIIPTGYTTRLDLAYLDFIDSEVKMFQLENVIPLDAPLGDYKIRVRVGMPTDDLWSADYFDFTATP